MKKLATVLIYINDGDPDQKNTGSGLASHGDDNYVLMINPNEHKSFWFNGVVAPVMAKMKTIIAHELGHLLGFLCGDKNHATVNKIVGHDNARVALDILRAGQIQMEFEAWANAHMIAGDKTLVEQLEARAKESYVLSEFPNRAN
jgi:hypothetical protein